MSSVDSIICAISLNDFLSTVLSLNMISCFFCIESLSDVTMLGKWITPFLKDSFIVHLYLFKNLRIVLEVLLKVFPIVEP